MISFQDRLKKRDATEGKATPAGAKISIEPHYREVWFFIDDALLENHYEGTRRGFRMDPFYAKNIAHLLLRAAGEAETQLPKGPDDDEPTAV